MPLPFLVLAVYGISFVVVHSQIFETPRSWLIKIPGVSGLISCVFCTGFWAGLATTVYLGLDNVVLWALALAVSSMVLDIAVSVAETWILTKN